MTVQLLIFVDSVLFFISNMKLSLAAQFHVFGNHTPTRMAEEVAWLRNETESCNFGEKQHRYAVNMLTMASKHDCE